MHVHTPLNHHPVTAPEKTREVEKASSELKENELYSQVFQRVI